ncbi:MAG: 16S rRNA (guanine(966)-N(2))-methyltransferase RsmD [Anaerolineae bacterium]|nr:16S rRNA (guanine(966)-N(2))-methyltransferase RsmD [Anaerolineae bacterium]
MRVIAGAAKGRTLRMVPGKGTRPIADKVKESLFNILGARVPDCRFLDLFAGTGSVGIEALSRGAEFAVFVEKAAQAIKVIHANLCETDLAEWAEVRHADAFDYLARTTEQFDIIYVAPPQYRRLWADALHALDERDLLYEDGVIVVQIFPKEFEPLPLQRFTLTDQRRYGSTTLCFYARLPSST